MIAPLTHTLETSGAVLRYDVRDSVPAGDPVLVMIGSPMARPLRNAGRALHRSKDRDV